MYNIGDDNELDRISREAAGRYSPPANGSNWELLSVELNKVLPVVEEKKRRGFFFWWVLPALLMGGGTAYWLVTERTTIKADVQKEAVAVITDKKDIVTENKNKTTIKADVQREPAVVTNDTQDLIVSNTKKETVETKVKAVKNNQPTKKSTIEPKQADLTEINTTVSKQNGQQVTVNPETAVIPQVINKTKEPEQKSNTDQSIQEAKETVKENKVEPAQEPAQSVTEELKEPATIPAFPVTRGKGWSYSFLAGLDKSTVKFKYGNSPGINLGIIGGYHFNDRLSIHTGAIYTQKNYKVAGEDFTAPKGSWASYYKIDNVEGYCRMWEVPLLLRYNLGQPAKKNVFLSTGLSSYFMTTENYTYHYYSSSGQLVTRNNEYNSSDTHILSIADFSVGFENRLTRNWSLLVEPYARIPLSGVGFGDIRLSSFGLNFSVQYRQPSKK